jgi:hypothetical protein
VFRIRIRDVVLFFKYQDPDPGEKPGSYFRDIGNNFLVKLLKFFDADPGWKKFGSGINITDP